MQRSILNPSLKSNSKIKKKKNRYKMYGTSDDTEIVNVN